MLNYLETKSPPKKIKNIFVFVHGYGANGLDLLSLSEYFKKDFPEAHFISPNAPFETHIMEYSYFWFDIGDRSEKYLNEGLKQAIPIFDDFIKSICNKYKVDLSQIIFCGFSQGTLISLHYGLSQKTAPHAIIGFSGGSLKSLKNNIQNQAPVCLIHGENDEVLESSHSEDAYKILNKNKQKAELKLIPKLGHTISQEGIEFALNFLKKL